MVMKTFFETIFSFLWNISVDFYTWVHTSYSEETLIISAIILALIGIYTCYKMYDSEINWFGGTLFACVFFFFYGVSLYLMYEVHFVHWENITDGYSGWTSMIIFAVFTLLLLISGLSNNRIIYALISFLCLYFSCLLLGKHAAWVLIPFIGCGGGSTFVGTFTDTHGNSYDVYRRD